MAECGERRTLSASTLSSKMLSSFVSQETFYGKPNRKKYRRWKQFQEEILFSIPERMKNKREFANIFNT